MGSFNPGASIWDVFSGILGSQAAGTAANQEVAAGTGAENYENSILQGQEQNLQPYTSAGSTSISQLMQGLQNGTYGTGSVQKFQAPTLAQAQQTPGYQFTQQQGDKGVLEGAAAAGGAISGGTMKSLAGYNTNLANTTYNNIYQQALQGYQANLSGQQQMYNQVAGTAQLGLGAQENVNASMGTNAYNIGNLMTGIGNAQAAGTIGQFNALNSGMSNFENSLPSFGMGPG